MRVYIDPQTNGPFISLKHSEVTGFVAKCYERFYGKENREFDRLRRSRYPQQYHDYSMLTDPWSGGEFPCDAQLTNVIKFLWKYNLDTRSTDYKIHHSFISFSPLTHKQEDAVQTLRKVLDGHVIVEDIPQYAGVKINVEPGEIKIVRYKNMGKTALCALVFDTRAYLKIHELFNLVIPNVIKALPGSLTCARKCHDILIQYN